MRSAYIHQLSASHTYFPLHTHSSASHTWRRPPLVPASFCLASPLKVSASIRYRPQLTLSINTFFGVSDSPRSVSVNTTQHSTNQPRCPSSVHVLASHPFFGSRRFHFLARITPSRSIRLLLWVPPTKKEVKKEQTLCTTSERARLEFLTQLARSVPVCVRGMRFSRALVAVGLLVFGVYPEWALGEGLGHGKLGHRITARRLERAQGLGISHRNHGGSIIHSRSLPSYPCSQIQPEITCTLRILSALRGMVGQHLPSDGTCIYSQVLPAQQYVHVNGQSVCCIDGRPNSVRTRNQRSIVARCNSAHNFLFSPPAPPAGRLVYPPPPLLGQKSTWKSMFRRHGLPAEGAVPDCCWQLFLL